MKKFIFTLLALMAILPAFADRYLTFGVNDSVRINPSWRGDYHGFMIRAHFDGRLDNWIMSFRLPQGMNLLNVYRKHDMLNIPYKNAQGEDDFCSAQLYVVHNNFNQRDSLSASIVEPGYWDPNNDGQYETYGTVKWEPGDYDQMCELLCEFSYNFPDTASFLVNEILFSTMDLRGFTIPYTYIRDKIVHLYVGLMLGDVNGDEVLGIGDVTTLADYLLDNITFDNYQEEAADINGDGIIDIADFSALTDLLLDAGQVSLEDLDVLQNM